MILNWIVQRVSPLSQLNYKSEEIITQLRSIDEQIAIDTEEIMRAAARGRLDIVQELLAKIASPNFSDSTGMTPLMAAAYEGHTQVVDLLLTAGDFAKQNGHKKTLALLKPD